MRISRKILGSFLIGTIIFSFTLNQLSPAQSNTTQEASVTAPTKNFRPFAGKDWNPQKLAAESLARHNFNQKQLQQLRRTGRIPAAETAAINVTDVSDVSVLQDNGTIIYPAVSFNLNARSVLFTPANNGYTVTSGLSAYDLNFGTKLNLTVAPAVNTSNPNAALGDDAYITQPLGFNFNFYGTAYSSVAVSSNGFLTFRPANTDNQFFDDNSTDSGESLLTFQTALPRIAAYWHDLDARAVSTIGTSGIYIRNDADRVVITWNNIRDYPNVTTDNGVHRFQIVLFSDGRIQFNYDQVQLTSTALVGISGGGNSASPVAVDFATPGNLTTTAPIAELFSLGSGIDEFNAIKAFYTAHPGQDNYDFIYILLDFNYTLPNNAFAYYLPLRNEISGNGQGTFDYDPTGLLGSTKFRGFLELGSLNLDYPEYPTTRFPTVGANHALSVMGQEQGHYWLAYPTYPLLSTRLLLGRDDEHWSFFFNSETSWSQPAARRSSNSEGNVWRNNGNGTFTSVNLIDGYSKLDQYLMGLRPAEQVPDSFVIINATVPFGINRTTSPTPNVTISGTSYPVSVSQIIQANGQVSPAPSGTTKNYRAAVLLIEQNGQQPSLQTMNKLSRYRLAWESYFAQSTDFLATINTGLTPLSNQRFIATTDGASFQPLAVPGEICSIFGQGLTNGQSLLATPGQALPLNLGGVEVKVDGTSAPLFYVGPYQINFQLPRTTQATTSLSGIGTVQSSTSTVEIFQNGQLIRAGAVQVAPAQISTFSISQDGKGAAAALDAIKFSAAPFNALQSNGQPNFIAVYLTGLGADATDTVGDISSQVQVTFNGQPMTVQYAGQAPGYVGLNQINFQLPVGVTTGTYPLVISRNGLVSNSTTIAIK